MLDLNAIFSSDVNAMNSDAPVSQSSPVEPSPCEKPRFLSDAIAFNLRCLRKYCRLKIGFRHDNDGYGEIAQPSMSETAFVAVQPKPRRWRNS
jgi:hypothetical protein